MKTTYHWNFKTNEIEVWIDGVCIGSRRTRIEAEIMGDEYRRARLAEPTPAPTKIIRDNTPVAEPPTLTPLALAAPEHVQDAQMLYEHLLANDPTAARTMRNELSAVFEQYYAGTLILGGARLWIEKIIDAFTPAPAAEPATCPTCEGAGATTIDGSPAASAGDLYPCPDCAGRAPRPDCPECDGRGWYAVEGDCGPTACLCRYEQDAADRAAAGRTHTAWAFGACVCPECGTQDGPAFAGCTDCGGSGLDATGRGLRAYVADMVALVNAIPDDQWEPENLPDDAPGSDDPDTGPSAVCAWLQERAEMAQIATAIDGANRHYAAAYRKAAEMADYAEYGWWEDARCWWVQSATRVNVRYRVSYEGCNCAAGLANRPCYHQALIEAAEAVYEEVAA